jgi:hypothetical protein
MSDATRKSLSNSPLTKPAVKKPVEATKKTLKKKEDIVTENKNTPIKSDKIRRKDTAGTVSDIEDIADKIESKKDATKTVKPLGNSKENKEPTKDSPSKDKAASGDEAEDKSETKRRSVLVPLKPHQIKEEVVETKHSEAR